jgi:hypothetical protein
MTIPSELTLLIASKVPGTDDESLVKVTLKKEVKDSVIRPNGMIKLKRPAPKHNKPGNWRDGSVVDGQSFLPHLTREHLFQGVYITICLMGA